MKLSTRGRYGVRAMLELAINSGKGPVPLRDLAARQEISAKYLEQLLIPPKGRWFGQERAWSAWGLPAFQRPRSQHFPV